MTDALRRLLTPADPVYVLPLHDGWDRVAPADPRVAGRLPAHTVVPDGLDAVLLPTTNAGPLRLPILEQRVRGEAFGLLDGLVQERIAAGATATLDDPAILRYRAQETAGDIQGVVVRYLLAVPGTGRRRGIEFLVAFPALPEELLAPLEALYDSIIASGTWRAPVGTGEAAGRG